LDKLKIRPNLEEAFKNSPSELAAQKENEALAEQEILS
jgi:hypothetical protein